MARTWASGSGDRQGEPIERQRQPCGAGLPHRRAGRPCSGPGEAPPLPSRRGVLSVCGRASTRRPTLGYACAPRSARREATRSNRPRPKKAGTTALPEVSAGMPAGMAQARDSPPPRAASEPCMNTWHDDSGGSRSGSSRSAAPCRGCGYRGPMNVAGRQGPRHGREAHGRGLGEMAGRTRSPPIGSQARLSRLSRAAETAI
jgi:hypothetical protein